MKSDILEMKYDIGDLRSLTSKYVIIAFVNEEKKRFLIRSGRTLAHVVNKLFFDQSSVRDYHKDFLDDRDEGKIRVYVLDYNVPDEVNMEKKREYTDILKSKGYTSYKEPILETLDKKVKVDVVEFKANVYFCLYRTVGTKKRVLGLFKDKFQLEYFVRKWYNKGVVEEEVYADNDITRKYIEMNDGDLKEDAYTYVRKYVI